MNVFFVSIKNKLFSKRNKDHKDKKSVRIIVPIAVAAVTVLCGLIIYLSLHMPSYSFCEGVGRYSLRVSDKEEREVFFLQFGYHATEVKSSTVVIPSSGQVLARYNEIQKSHGMNILPYGDKSAQMYEYDVEGGGEVQRGYLVVYRGRVVAAHLAGSCYPSYVMGLKQQ